MRPLMEEAFGEHEYDGVLTPRVSVHSHGKFTPEGSAERLAVNTNSGKPTQFEMAQFTEGRTEQYTAIF